MAKTEDTSPPAPPQPGPTDVTMDEVMAELSQINAEQSQQLAVLRIKTRKQESLIAALQRELAKEV